MATPDIAYEIGHYFCNRYYHVLCETPEYSHWFYSDSSTMTRIDDAAHTQTVSTRLDIHELLTSLSVTEVALSELNVQFSWYGGILLTVFGIMESRNFYGKRKFSQTFFLATWGFDFFILNDILQIQDQVPELPDIMIDQQPAISVSSHELEETREYFNSLHIDKYSLPDEDLQFETVVEEASVEQSSPLASVVNHLEDPIHWPARALASARVDEVAVKPAAESAREPARVSYASILQASKGQSQSVIPRQRSVRQSMPASEATNMANPMRDSVEITPKPLEPTSVFVRNLPSHVTNGDLEKEFKNFGKIKPNGVSIRNKTLSPHESARVDELAAESVKEPGRVSNDSIFQAPKGSSQSFVPRQPSVRQSMPTAMPAPDLELKIQGNEQQLNSSTSSFVPQAAVTGADDILLQAELTSVLVGNLPSHVTNADLEKEFKNFGKIKPNGVTIRNKTETGVCFAFIEFEDMSGAHNAIKASPIKFLGNQVYIKERIASSSTSTRGGVVQGGRGRYPGYSTLFGLLLVILLLLTTGYMRK